MAIKSLRLFWWNDAFYLSIHLELLPPACDTCLEARALIDEGCLFSLKGYLKAFLGSEEVTIQK